MAVVPRGPWALVLVGAVAMLSACDCDKSPLQPASGCAGVANGQPGRTASCAADAECAVQYGCRAVASLGGATCCLLAPRACATEAECCPGQACPANRRECLDRSTPCTIDADCGEQGDHVCQAYTDASGSSSRCRLRPCGSAGECPGDQACFQGECVAGLPCGGACPSGQACVATLGRCQDFAHPLDAGAACPLSCAPGFVATFNDGRALWDTCALASVACVCAELPPLRSSDLGRHSALAVSPGRAAYVSSYDGVFGDLVVATYALDGGLQRLEYVDGVPDGGPVTYGPSGPRGGRASPGPDVGRATDVALGASGQLYVSYYDVDHGDLKVAIRDAAGHWTVQTVDGATGDVGRYTSVAVDAQGRPGVAFFQAGAEAGFLVAECPAPRPTGPLGRVTALKFARASTPLPAGPGDWAVRTLACLDRPPPVCDRCTGLCATVDPVAGPGCFAAATGCAACTQACVAVNGTPTCAPRYTPLDLAEVPVGVGLFASLSFRGDEALIAAMRRTASATAGGPAKGELVGISVSGANVAGPLVVLDGRGDTGWFPDLKVDPATRQVGIAYHDATTRSLRLYLAPQLQAGVGGELIDSGLDGVASQSSVGTDSALVFLPGGGALAVYQDATHGDLKVARRGAGGWVVQGPVSTVGGVGFFADAAFSEGTVYVSHARLRARVVQGIPRPDTRVLLEQLAP